MTAPFCRPQDPSGELISAHLVVHRNTSADGLFDFSQIKKLQSANSVITETRLIMSSEKDSQLAFHRLEDQVFLDSENPKMVLKLEPEECVLQTVGSGECYKEGIWSLMGEDSRSASAVLENSDLIRFGRQTVKFLVSKVEKPNEILADINSAIFAQKTAGFDFVNCYANDKLSNDMEVSITPSQTSLGEANNLCRVCMESERKNRPFVLNACACSEAMPLHADCLVKFVRYRCKPFHFKHYTYYDLTAASCDICKQRFPCFLNVNERVWPLLKFVYPTNSKFAALLVYKIGTSEVRHLLVIDLVKEADQTLTIGRGEGCAVKFSDPSVNLLHSQLTIRKNELRIANCDAVYGTLKRVSKSVKLQQMDNKVLVIGPFSVLFHIVSFPGICQCLKREIGNLQINPVKAIQKPTSLRSVGPEKPKAAESDTRNDLDDLPDSNSHIPIPKLNSQQRIQLSGVDRTVSAFKRSFPEPKLVLSDLAHQLAETPSWVGNDHSRSMLESNVIMHNAFPNRHFEPEATQNKPQQNTLRKSHTSALKGDNLFTDFGESTIYNTSITMYKFD